jgi:HlyD family secretion protein
MDIARPSRAREKKIRRIIYGSAAGVGVLLITLGLSRLKPAAPTVETGTLVIDTVKRGELTRQVRGLGTLVPEEIRWIPAITEGRVERLVLQPGAEVKPDSVIIELSSPDVQLAVLEAESQLRQAEAQLAELRGRLESQYLDQKANAARVQAEYAQAKMRAEITTDLAKQGLESELNAKLQVVAAEELANRDSIERQRLEMVGDSIKAQTAVQEAAVEQRRALARLRRSQLEALKVKAGIKGVLQLIAVEVGQRVAPGTNLARVAQPEKLKAVVRVAETQVKDVAVGQPAIVDTRTGVIPGKVIRIDPASQNATVAVDIALEGALPKGARPDLTVDGTIELEHLPDVLKMGRPAQGQAESLISLFRLVPGTSEAVRVKVKLGRNSVTEVEVMEGLQAGDRVVLSDTSAWDAFDRIRLN